MSRSQGSVCQYCGFDIQTPGGFHERGGCGEEVGRRILDGDLTVLEVLVHLTNTVADLTNTMSHYRHRKP